jgi:hypothetical protein
MVHSITDRYISDTIVAALKKSPSSNFQALGHSLFHDWKRSDLTFLQNRLSVEVASLSSSTTVNETVSSSSSPSDAPAAFVADRQPREGRGGGNWKRAGRKNQRASSDVRSSHNTQRQQNRESSRDYVPD